LAQPAHQGYEATLAALVTLGRQELRQTLVQLAQLALRESLAPQVYQEHLGHLVLQIILEQLAQRVLPDAEGPRALWDNLEMLAHKDTRVCQGLPLTPGQRGRQVLMGALALLQTLVLQARVAQQGKSETPVQQVLLVKQVLLALLVQLA
jgi:hypothetical protein